jgi:Flp pilus assembly protein TadG
VSAIEFAFIAPVLMLLIANIIDLSMYAFSRIQVDVAAQQGARTVLVACELDKLPVTCTANADTKIQEAINSTSLGNKVAWVKDPNEKDRGYWCSNTTTGALYWAGKLTDAPPTTCTNPGIYIKVRVEYEFTPFFDDLSAIKYMADRTIIREAITRLL